MPCPTQIAFCQGENFKAQSPPQRGLFGAPEQARHGGRCPPYNWCSGPSSTWWALPTLQLMLRPSPTRWAVLTLQLVLRSKLDAVGGAHPTTRRATYKGGHGPLHRSWHRIQCRVGTAHHPPLQIDHSRYATPRFAVLKTKNPASSEVFGGRFSLKETWQIGRTRRTRTADLYHVKVAL